MFQSPRSSVVNMRLIAQGETHRVAQSGPDFLILAEPAQLPVGVAELIVTVEGEETKRRFQIAKPVKGLRVIAKPLEDSSALAA